jgi:hypothetical protein
MTLDDILAHTKGEILANKATAIIDGVYTVLAVVEGSEWVLTEAGRAAEAELSNVLAQKPRKTKSMLVESQVAVSEPALGLQPQGTP